MKLSYRFGGLVIGLLAALAAPASAQLYWDGTDTTADADGGAGVWDVATTPNWDTAATGGGSATWTNGGNAVFPDAAANYTVSVAAGGLTVKNITLAPSAAATPANVILNAQLQNDVLAVSPGAVWDANGRTLRVINDNTLNDLVVGVGAGNTLTIKNSAATAGLVSFELRGSRTAWAAQNSSATLDVVSPMSLRGGGTSVGTFGTVKLVGGSTYIHNSNNGNVITNDFANYNNQFVLGTGVVTFDRQQEANNNGRAYYNGVISGPGQLRVNVAGVPATDGQDGPTVALNAANTYLGGTDVASGQLMLMNPNVMPATGTRNIQAGAGLRMIYDNSIWTEAGISAMASSFTFAPGSYLALEVAASTTQQLTTDLAGSNYGLYKVDTGVLEINTPQTGLGDSIVGNGTLRLNVNNGLSPTAALRIGHTGVGGTFELNGRNQTVAGLTSASGNGFRRIMNSTTDGIAPSVLTIDTPTGQAYAYGSTLGGNSTAVTDPDANNLSLVKNGLGSQTILTSNYTGTTTINAGTLGFNGDATATATGITTLGDVTVNSGATLTGTGTIGRNTIVNNGATLAPGAVGTAGARVLSFGTKNLTLNSTSILALDLLGTDQTVGGATPVNDLVETVANLTLDGVLNVSELTASSFASATLGNSWRLINYSGTLTNNTLALGAMPTLGSGLAFAIDTTVAGQVNLNIVSGPAGVIGDYNKNGTVDAADYTIWRDNNGTAFALDNRDPANTGNLSNADYLSWRSRFGNTASVAASIASAGAVPEPRAIVMLGLLSVAGWILTRRQS